MKKNTHPQYNAKAVIKCACGNEIKTGSTVEKIDIELCSGCHPFYTGKQKLVDTARRVEKFKERASKAGAGATNKKAKQAKRAAKKEDKQEA